MKDCIFCAIVSGDSPAHVVFEDAATVAFLDINPATRGHSLVVPRTHVDDIWDVDREGAARVMASAWEVARRIRDVLDPAGCNIVQASGPAAWQTVFHLHVHVVPRYDPEELRRPWTPTPGNRDELEEVALLLRSG